MACLAYPVWRALAAVGNLDTSFSGDGKFALPWVYPDSQYEYKHKVEEVLIQPDPNNVLVERVITAYSSDYECYAPTAISTLS